MTPDELKDIGKNHVKGLERAQIPWKHLAAAVEPGEEPRGVFACRFEGLTGGCVVTNRRLLVVGGGSLGSLRKKQTEVDLDAVAQVRSSGLRVEVIGGGTDLELSMVNRADELVRAINTARRRPATTPTPAADDPAASLRKLAELRDAGVVTAAEFDAKKAELLSRL